MAKSAGTRSNDRATSKEEKAAEHKPLPLEHVAIIMDGNRRWADLRHFPRLFGHKEGVKSLKRLVRHVGGRGLKYLTVYAFSSENWQRSKEEVNYLLELFATVLRDEFDELNESKVKLSFLGSLCEIPGKLRASIEVAMEKTKHNTGLSLQIAINYGSRLELTEAMRSLAQDVKDGKLQPQDIDESAINDRLYTRNMPDPALLIRTGGEMRLSNYLLWQAAYTEIYVTPVLWPEFTPADFEKAIDEFSARERRYGGD
jgi:undecaprenyl diphosphate synthase